MATLSFNPDLPPKNDKAHALQLHPVRRKSTEYLDEIDWLAEKRWKRKVHEGFVSLFQRSWLSRSFIGNTVRYVRGPAKGRVPPEGTM